MPSSGCGGPKRRATCWDDARLEPARARRRHASRGVLPATRPLRRGRRRVRARLRPSRRARPRRHRTGRHAAQQLGARPAARRAAARGRGSLSPRRRDRQQPRAARPPCRRCCSTTWRGCCARSTGFPKPPTMPRAPTPARGGQDTKWWSTSPCCCARRSTGSPGTCPAQRPRLPRSSRYCGRRCRRVTWRWRRSPASKRRLPCRAAISPWRAPPPTAPSRSPRRVPSAASPYRSSCKPAPKSCSPRTWRRARRQTPGAPSTWS